MWRTAPHTALACQPLGRRTTAACRSDESPPRPSMPASAGGWGAETCLSPPGAAAAARRRRQRCGAAGANLARRRCSPSRAAAHCSGVTPVCASGDGGSINDGLSWVGEHSPGFSALRFASAGSPQVVRVPNHSQFAVRGPAPSSPVSALTSESRPTQTAGEHRRSGARDEQRQNTQPGAFMAAQAPTGRAHHAPSRIDIFDRLQEHTRPIPLSLLAP